MNFFLLVSAFVFFLAGFETSSTLLTFCSHLLAKHPEIQEKARNEITNVLKRYNGEFTYDAMLEMKYLDQVLKGMKFPIRNYFQLYHHIEYSTESLRKYPPITMLTRGATADYWVKEGGKSLLIPKGCTVVIPVYAIQNDPDIYKDPERFDPDRFLPEEENKRHPYSFLPFGEGDTNQAYFAFVS